MMLRGSQLSYHQNTEYWELSALITGRELASNHSKLVAFFTVKSRVKSSLRQDRLFGSISIEYAKVAAEALEHGVCKIGVRRI
jgi:hypothetical protein